MRRHERRPVDLLVLVTAMIALPGERACDWWGSTGYQEAVEAQGDIGADPVATFMHDLSPGMREVALSAAREQAVRPTTEPWPLPAWPTVATRFVLCTQDRFFPAPFMRRVVSERLGVTPDELEAGHLPMLARPGELADLLVSYAA